MGLWDEVALDFFLVRALAHFAVDSRQKGAASG